MPRPPSLASLTGIILGVVGLLAAIGAAIDTGTATINKSRPLFCNIEVFSSWSWCSPWVYQGVADCPDRDTPPTDGDKPKDERCTSAGLIAVCWDGHNYKNGPKGAWCTYKNIPVQDCITGGNVGRMYKCVPKA